MACLYTVPYKDFYDMTCSGVVRLRKVKEGTYIACLRHSVWQTDVKFDAAYRSLLEYYSLISKHDICPQRDSRRLPLILSLMWQIRRFQTCTMPPCAAWVVFVVNVHHNWRQQFHTHTYIYKGLRLDGTFHRPWGRPLSHFLLGCLG